MAKTDSDDIKYLKQDAIGKIIAQGLSELYQKKPEKPVSYLAHWLLTYSDNCKKAQEIQKKGSERNDHAQKFKKSESIKADQIKKSQSIREEGLNLIKQFERKIQGHEYHVEMLAEDLPEFLQQTLKLTGVYVGQLNHPPKNVTDEDSDENAHLQLDQPKVINYIGSSKSHKNLMVGKTLSLNQGVTAQAFNLVIDEPPAEEGKDQPKEPKPKYVYVSDVVKNEKIYYFKIPKLGAYIAIPLVFKTYLFESSFDKALEERKKYLQSKEDFEKQKQSELEQIIKELDDAEGRHAKHVQKGQQQQAQQVQEELKEIKTRHENKLAEELDYKQPEHDSHKKQFVVCADTLGQDREINQKDRDFLLNIVNKFKQQLELKQLKILNNDVEYQIGYEKQLEKPIEQLMEELDKELELTEEQTKQLNQVHKEPKLLEYYTNISKLRKLHEQLNQPKYQKYLLDLNKFRVLKFSSLVQHVLYFLGFPKSKVDIPKTTHLNWKSTKDNIATKEMLKKLLEYEFKGPKAANFVEYSKVNHLKPIFDKISEDQVFHYNIGLGLVLRIVKLLFELRLQDVQIRRESIEKLRAERQEMLEQNKTIENQKQVDLEQHKSTLQQEELDNFNEVQWIKNYETEHPLQEIPPEIKDDIDNDI